LSAVKDVEKLILAMTNEPLLIRIETADIACTRNNHAMLTEEELQERQYKASCLNGTWVYAETRDGKRVGHISGVGLPAKVETLEEAMEWLRAENSKTIRVRVAPTEANAPLVDWLMDAGFKRLVRVHQWYISTDAPVDPKITRRRGKTYENAYTIREIGPDLAGEFARIVSINYRFKPGRNLSWLERHVGAPGITTFLALDGLEPIGTGMLQGVGDISLLGYGTTLRLYRKRGIQNAMIAERIRKSRELGFQLTVASTYGTDQSSRNLRRQGFLLAGEVGVYGK
jgi:hypothetical protein